jgi:hypothetical protein
MTYLNRLFSTILLSIFYSLSQETEAQSISLPLDLRINKEVAQRDIALHKIKIFGQGGISPVAYRKEDSLFERRYHITYMLFGCVAPYEYGGVIFIKMSLH